MKLSAYRAFIFWDTPRFFASMTVIILGMLHFFALPALGRTMEENAISHGFLAARAERAKTSTAKRQEKASPASSIIERRHYIIENNSRYSVHMEYPSTGFVLMDSDIANWARQQVNFFIAGLANIPADDPTHFIFNVTYERIQPSLRACSIVFYTTTDTGGTRPEQGMVTLSYMVQEGRRLTLNDLFADTDGIIPFLSTYTRGRLALRNSEIPDPQRILSGTTPDAVNFSLFALGRDSLIIYFAPNQVSSPSEGSVSVSIPLSDLARYKPNLALWGRSGTAYSGHNE